VPDSNTGMADDQTKLIISIETVLKNMDRTLAELSKVETSFAIADGPRGLERGLAQGQIGDGKIAR